MSKREKIESAIASQKHESIMPSQTTLDYINLRLAGKIDCDTHISNLKKKYLVET